jgi:hypothetical protein
MDRMKLPDDDVPPLRIKEPHARHL